MSKISIIVPIYNCEKYLPRCIDSILNQSFSDFELLLVDDGSTDSSLKVCTEYKNRDSRIFVFNKENGGQSSARNLGLKKATGEYICFVDSDDWITKDCIEYLYDLLLKHKADVSSANYQLAYSENCIIENHHSSEKTVVGNIEILKFFLLQDKLNHTNDFSPWAKLYKKEFFDFVKFPEGQIYEDNITNFKILNNCSKYVKSSRKIYYYFQNQNSTTKSVLRKKHLSLIDIANEQIELCLRYNDSELNLLALRKLGMSYFSLLAMYVRYGTDLEFSEIKELVKGYRNNKKIFIDYEKSIKIHLISFLMCINIRSLRNIYIIFSHFTQRRHS